jgi:DsbC/DsbD-like thiol-disulfide interchange protein
MKTLRWFVLTLLLVSSMTAFAQQKRESEGATVVVSVLNQDKLKVGDKATLQIEVTPKAGWHVYSAIPSEDGVYKQAELGWELDSRGFEAEKELKEEGYMTEMRDDILDGMVRYYKAKVIFTQSIKVTDKSVILVGYFDYMACNEEKCIPLTAEFKLEVKAKD